MSIALYSGKSKLKTGVIFLIVFQSFMLFGAIVEIDKENAFITIGVNLVLLGVWIFLFQKVKNRVGLHISFNEKYLLIQDKTGNREIEMNHVISFTKSMISINNHDSYTLVFRDKGQRKSVQIRLLSNNPVSTIFQNRLKKVKRVKQGKEIPQRAVYPKNVMRRR